MQREIRAFACAFAEHMCEFMLTDSELPFAEVPTAEGAQAKQSNTHTHKHTPPNKHTTHTHTHTTDFFLEAFHKFTQMAGSSLLAACILVLAAASVAQAQFGPLPKKNCTGPSPNRCNPGQLCPEDFADPNNNLATPRSEGIRLFEIEGKVTAIDLTNRVVVVNGQQVRFPPEVETIETGKLPSDSPTLFSSLTASELGGTMIINGVINLRDSGCIDFRATDAFYEIAENVIVGQLSRIDLANSVSF